MSIGILEESSGIIDAPIARKEGSIIERCISKNGQASITHYDVIKQIDNMSLVHFMLETGRTHQIRVHAKYIRTSNCSEILSMEFLLLQLIDKLFIRIR